MLIKSRRLSVPAKLYTVAITVSIASQISEIQSVMRPLMYASWALMAIYILAATGKLYIGQYAKLIILATGILFCVCVILSVWQGTPHIRANFLQSVLIPFFVYIVSYNLLREITKSEMQYLLRLYILMAVVLAVVFVVQYVPSYQAWLSANTYLLGQKNSAAQIFSSAALLSLFGIEKGKKWARYASAGLLLGATLLFQCRAAILGICAAMFFVYTLFSRRKLLIGIIGLLILFFVIYNDTTWAFVQQALNLNKVMANPSLDALSSGRLGNYTQALKVFAEHPIVGVGEYRVDNLYISMLAELGIVGFCILIPTFFTRLFLNIQCLRNKSNPITNTIFLLTVFYFVESWLERLPPYGPGVSSFMFWTLCGYLDANFPKRNRKTEETHSLC